MISGPRRVLIAAKPPTGRGRRGRLLRSVSSDQMHRQHAHAAPDGDNGEELRIRAPGPRRKAERGHDDDAREEQPREELSPKKP